MDPNEINHEDLFAFLIQAINDEPSLLAVEGKFHPSRSQFKRCVRIWDWLVYAEDAKKTIRKLDDDAVM